MLEVLKRKIKKFRKDNKGSAIVLVIVALAMVGILAMTIMWMSMTNYYMKATDKGNKMGFYSAETVLEQIKAGLEEEASYSAARAYAFVLTKDYSADSSSDRNYEFKKAYQDYFVGKVADGSDSSKYDLSYLLGFVDSAAGVSLSKSSTGSIKWLSSSDPKFVHTYSSDLMKLEGLHLEYTESGSDGAEYVSVIDTDIIIMVPDVSFTQTSILPDVFEYALVADKKLENTNIGETDVDGNIYAGEEGIDLYSKFKVSYSKQNEGRLISKGDVKIGTGNPIMPSATGTELVIDAPDLGGMSEFWASDITLGNGAKLTTDKADTYIADDLTLSGRKAKVKMKDGAYYGYGSSNDEPGKSSAIVVNGLGSTVDLKDLNKVMLLGRTYVSIPNEVADPLSPTGKREEPAVFPMGESVAVKGEQVAFLVPDECLKYVETISGNEVKRNMPNPFLSSDFPINANIRVSLSANGINLNRYVTEVKSAVRPHGNNGLGYVYMKMDGDKANEYYRAYYKNNKEKLDNYYMVYAGNNKVVLPQSNDLNSEGNILTALYPDTLADPADPLNPSDSDKIIKNTNSQLYSAIPESDKDLINGDLTQKKNNLCAKLVKEGATTSELANTLFDNLILRDDVINLVGRNGNPYKFEAEAEDGHKNYAVFAKNDTGTPYICDDDSIRVLIVIGDVEVETDFTGLLIASGKITINGDQSIKSIVNATDDEMQELRDTLQKEQLIDYLPTVSAGSLPRMENRTALQYFRDGSGYALDGLGKSGESTVSRNNIDFTELVKFNNWIKK